MQSLSVTFTVFTASTVLLGLVCNGSASSIPHTERGDETCFLYIDSPATMAYVQSSPCQVASRARGEEGSITYVSWLSYARASRPNMCSFSITGFVMALTTEGSTPLFCPSRVSPILMWRVFGRL